MSQYSIHFSGFFVNLLSDMFNDEMMHLVS